MIESVILEDVAETVMQFGLREGISFELRTKWPDIHFTYCQDDDITAARPVRASSHFNLYLVAGGEGCISFTSDHERATGIVVAEIEDGEEA